MINQFRKSGNLPDEVRQFQDSVSLTFRDIISKQIIDGILIENIKIVNATPYAVNHGLGHAIRGWIIVRKDANAIIWESSSATPSKTFILNTSATVTISLWVF